MTASECTKGLDEPHYRAPEPAGFPGLPDLWEEPNPMPDLPVEPEAWPMGLLFDEELIFPDKPCPELDGAFL
jgi:hypothetical protein